MWIEIEMYLGSVLVDHGKRTILSISVYNMNPRSGKKIIDFSNERQKKRLLCMIHQERPFLLLCGGQHFLFDNRTESNWEILPLRDIHSKRFNILPKPVLLHPTRSTLICLALVSNISKQTKKWNENDLEWKISTFFCEISYRLENPLNDTIPKWSQVVGMRHWTPSTGRTFSNRLSISIIIRRNSL